MCGQTRAGRLHVRVYVSALNENYHIDDDDGIGGL